MPKKFRSNFHILSGDDLARIKRGPIRHDELPAYLIKQLDGIYRDVAHFLWPTLEAWELADDEGLALVAALLSISSGVGLTDVRDLQMVSENVAHRLVACWITLFGPTCSPINVAKARSR